MPDEATKGNREKIVDALNRKNAEFEKLHRVSQNAQTLLNAILKNTDDHILVCDENGSPVAFNTSFSKTIEAAFDIIVKPGLNLLELLPDRHLADFWVKLHRRVLSGEKFKCEHSFQFADGTVRCFESSFTPVYEKDKVAGFTKIERDITARKQYEEELKDSENKYRLLTESQNDLVVKFDAGYKLSYVSPNYCRTFGKTQADLIGKDFIHLIHEDDRDQVFQSLKRLIREPYTTYHRERAFTIYGVRWFAWSNRAILDEEKKIKEIIAVGRDITEQQIAEEALRESELRYRTLVENAFEGIAVSIDDRFVFLNPRILELLGYSHEEGIHKKIFDFVHPKDQGLVSARLDQRLRGELNEPYTECRIIRKDGKSNWVRVFFAKVQWDGHPAFLFFFSDINELKRMFRQRKVDKYHLTYRN